MLYDAFCGGDAWVLTSYGNYTRQSKPVYPFDGSMLRWGMGIAVPVHGIWATSKILVVARDFLFGSSMPRIPGKIALRITGTRDGATSSLMRCCPLRDISQPSAI